MGELRLFVTNYGVEWVSLDIVPHLRMPICWRRMPRPKLFGHEIIYPLREDVRKCVGCIAFFMHLSMALDDKYLYIEVAMTKSLLHKCATLLLKH